jgi:hypothetical protein
MSELTRYQAEKIAKFIDSTARGWCEEAIFSSVNIILEGTQSIHLPPLEPFVWHEATPENLVRIPKFLYVLVKFGFRWSGDSDYRDGSYWRCNNDAPYTHFMLIE